MLVLHGFKKVITLSASAVITVLLLSLPTFAQQDFGNWVFKSATDTTVVACWNDSESVMMFPPGAMYGMMSSFPDSIYFRIGYMPMDSLLVPHDSTFIGWYRIQVGSDSLDFNMMNYSMMGGYNMMRFYKGIPCYFYWDSSEADSGYRDWHPTGLMGWDGSNWVTMPGVTFNGNGAYFNSSSVYSAIAFVGHPATETAVTSRTGTPAGFELKENYPNPFNPTTIISYRLPATSHVTLKVYDILGNEVATLANGIESAGVHSVEFNGADLSSGVYFYRLSTPGYVRTMKMVLLK